VIGKKRFVLFQLEDNSYEYQEVFGIASRLSCNYEWLTAVKVIVNMETSKKPVGSLDLHRAAGSQSNGADGELTPSQIQTAFLDEAELSVSSSYSEKVTINTIIREGHNQDEVSYSAVDQSEEVNIEEPPSEKEYKVPSQRKDKVKALPSDRSLLPNLLTCGTKVDLNFELVPLHKVPKEFHPLIQAVVLYGQNNSNRCGFLGMEISQYLKEGKVPLFKIPASWWKRKANDRFAIALWIELAEGELYLIDVEQFPGQIFLLMFPEGVFLTEELLSYIIHRRLIDKKGWPSWDSHDGTFSYQGINHSNMDKASNDILNRIQDHIVFLEEEFHQFSF